jgi:hypothetical protein
MMIIVRGLPGSGKNSINIMSDFFFCSYGQMLTAICDTGYVRRGAFHQEVMEEMTRIAERVARTRVPTVFITQAPRIREVKKITDIAEKWGCPYHVISIEESLCNIKKTLEDDRFSYERILSNEEFTKIATDFQNSLKAANSAFPGKHTVVSRSEEIDSVNVSYNGQYHIPGKDRSRVWVFGDLHGKRRLLQKALRELPDDAIIFSVGDLIDRGEDSMGCLFDLMDDDRFKLFTMGNHELRFLEEEIAGFPCRSRAREQTHREFDALSESDKVKVMDFLKYRSRPSINFNSLLGMDETPHVILSHTGIGGDYLDYPNHTMTTNGAVNSIIDFTYPEAAIGKILQVHGHYSWEYTGDTSGCIVNIDSGAYYTGVLRFFNPYTREVFDVRE